MSYLSNLEKKLWPGHRVRLDPEFVEKTKSANFSLVDVGATAGPDERWSDLGELCEIVGIDPDPRADIRGIDRFFETALSDVTGKRRLQLTEFGAASSFHEFNETELSSFANWPQHRIVDEIELETTTLDELCQVEKFEASFIKVDAEGHDFSILLGAQQELATNILGLQVEVSFLVRHLSTGQFTDIHSLLTERGFQLHSLETESWLRDNLTWGVNSSTQIIWGDALYVLSPNELGVRLRKLGPKKAEELFLRFFLILLVYGFHDYALHILDVSEKYIDESILVCCRRSVNDSIEPVLQGLLRSFFGAFAGVLVGLLSIILFPLRSNGMAFMKRRLFDFSTRLNRWSSRGGYLQASIVE